MAKSNHTSDLTLSKNEDGYLRHYLHIIEDNVIRGLACVNYD